MLVANYGTGLHLPKDVLDPNFVLVDEATEETVAVIIDPAKVTKMEEIIDVEHYEVAELLLEQINYLGTKGEGFNKK